jgi:hypothetical protein
VNVLLVSHYCRCGEPFTDLEWEAAALTENADLDVWVVPWYNLAVGDDDSVTLSGPAYRSENLALVETQAPVPRRFDAVICFAIGDTVEIDETAPAVEQAALERLSRLGTGRGRLNLVLNCLRHAASVGQITNVERGELELDNKASLSKILDTTDATPGSPRLRRPHTVVCAPSELATVIASLDSPSNYLVKPAGGTRGDRIRMASAISPTESFESDRDWIVQELQRNPWTIRGHKADIRVYVIIDTRARERSFVTDARLVRLAAVPYQRGVLEAEITSNSCRKRLKLPPATYPLDQLPDAPRSELREVRWATERAARDFIDAYFWWARNQNAGDNTHRVLLWGLDFLLQRSPTTQEISAHFLEANFYPYLFQFPENCLPVIWKLMAKHYGRALRDALTHGSEAGSGCR